MKEHESMKYLATRKKQRSKIEWTHYTWNFVQGCTHASPGCRKCYAESMFNKYNPGKDFSKVIVKENKLEEPLHWKYENVYVFVNSQSDTFHEDLPPSLYPKIMKVFRECQKLKFIVLTKRPEIMKHYFDLYPPPDNVIASVTCEDQKRFDLRFPLLYRTNVEKKMISFEPMMELVQIREGFDWAICGGMSGMGASPFHLEWARDLRDQCRAMKIPFFMKQVGSNAFLNGQPFRTKDFKGGNQDEWPEDLRIREFPKW